MANIVDGIWNFRIGQWEEVRARMIDLALIIWESVKISVGEQQVHYVRGNFKDLFFEYCFMVYFMFSYAGFIYVMLAYFMNEKHANFLFGCDSEKLYGCLMIVGLHMCICRILENMWKEDFFQLIKNIKALEKKFVNTRVSNPPAPA